MALEDTPQDAADAAELVLHDFGYAISGDCAMHVAHAVLCAMRASVPADRPGQHPPSDPRLSEDDAVRIINRAVRQRDTEDDGPVFEMTVRAVLRAARGGSPPDTMQMADDVLTDKRKIEDVLGELASGSPDPQEPSDPDHWGRIVREAWVSWARTQPSPKASWLVPYDQLSESDKEADRQIGLAVLRAASPSGRPPQATEAHEGAVFAAVSKAYYRGVTAGGATEAGLREALRWALTYGTFDVAEDNPLHAAALDKARALSSPPQRDET
jgi:hypothetical protein